MSVRNALILPALTCGMMLTLGCDSGGRRNAPPAPIVEQTPAPADDAPEPTEKVDKPDEPTTRPVETQPTAPERDRDSTLPDYLTVLERIHPGRLFKVDAELSGDRRLIIDTRNVKRIRLDRRRLDLTHNRSIALRIDEQGIEWTTRSAVVELQRANDGVWAPVKPIKPGP